MRKAQFAGQVCSGASVLRCTCSCFRLYLQAVGGGFLESEAPSPESSLGALWNCCFCVASCKAKPPSPKTEEERRIMAKAGTFERLCFSLLVPHGKALKENTNLQGLVAALRACFRMMHLMHLHCCAQLVSRGLSCWGPGLGVARRIEHREAYRHRLEGGPFFGVLSPCLPVSRRKR